MFFIGQKVVCIHDGYWGHPSDIGVIATKNNPVFNQVYTVTKVLIDPIEKECLHLKEYPTSNPYGFASRAFRPVTEGSTEAGMSILKKILVTGKITKEKKHAMS